MSRVKKLTKNECFDLEKVHLETEVSKKELKNVKLRMANQRLKKQVFETEIKGLHIENQLLISHQSTVEEEITGLTSDREEILESIKNRLGIKGAITFDPDTLEVIPQQPKTGEK